MRAELHSGFILHRRRYRETSLILDVLSSRHGRVGLVARGALGKNKPGGDLHQPFRLMQIAWSGRSELCTLTKLEPLGAPAWLSGERLYSGMYCNELVMRIVGVHDPNPELFDAYARLVSELSSEAPLEPTLRLFEKTFLDACGYGLNLAQDADRGDNIATDVHYHYVVERGACRQAGGEGVPVSGKTLLGLAQDPLPVDLDLVEAKRLMRFVIDHYLDGRPLASRSLFERPGPAKD